MNKIPIVLIFSVSGHLVATSGSDAKTPLQLSVEGFEFEYDEECNRGTLTITSESLDISTNKALQLYSPLLIKWGYITEKGYLLNGGEKVIITDLKYKYNRSGIRGTIIFQDYMYYNSQIKENPVSYEEVLDTLIETNGKPPSSTTIEQAKAAGTYNLRVASELEYKKFDSIVNKVKPSLVSKASIDALGILSISYSRGITAQDLKGIKGSTSPYIYPKMVDYFFPDQYDVDIKPLLKTHNLSAWLKKNGYNLSGGAKEIIISGDTFEVNNKDLKQSPLRVYNLLDENSVLDVEFSTKDLKSDANIDSVTTTDAATLETTVIQNISVDIDNFGDISREKANEFLDSVKAWIEAGGKGDCPSLYLNVPNISIDKVYVAGTPKMGFTKGDEMLVSRTDRRDHTKTLGIIPSFLVPMRVSSYPAMVVDELKNRLENEKLEESLKKYHATLEVEGDYLLKNNTTIFILGVSRMFSGKYFLSAVKHKISKGIYTTTMECLKIPTEKVNLQAIFKTNTKGETTRDITMFLVPYVQNRDAEVIRELREKYFNEITVPYRSLLSEEAMQKKYFNIVNDILKDFVPSIPESNVPYSDLPYVEEVIYEEDANHRTTYEEVQKYLNSRTPSDYQWIK